MDYSIEYQWQTGKPIRLVRSDGKLISITDDSPEYQEFLKWNSTQQIPIDLKPTIEPIKPVPGRNLAKEIDVINTKLGIK